MMTGCSSSGNKDAQLAVYELKDLEPGVYLQKGDENAFVEFMSEGKAYDNTYASDESQDNTRIVWFANKDSLIPEITKDDHIIMITTEDIPSMPQLYPLDDYGYTIGCTLYKDSASDLWALSQDQNRDICSESSFEENFNNGNNDSNTLILDVGGKKVSDDNISTVGSVTGLEKDKEYTIGLYNGTVYSEITAVCDTHLFVDSLQPAYMCEQYLYTKDGYLIVDLPDDLPSGYYYFDDFGLFKYTV